MAHPMRLPALAMAAIAGLGLTATTAVTAAAGTAASAGVPGGTQLWATSYHGNAQRNIAAAAVASPDGATVYVTGLTGLAHFSTVAYNAATGKSRWVATFYGRGYSQPSAMAVSPDGSKVFVTGFTTPAGAANNDQFVTVAYNAATGARLWVQRTFNIFHLGSVATAVTVSPDGSSVFVAGDAGKNPVLVAYDSTTGAQRWVSRYQVPLGAAGTEEGVAVSPDGSVVFLTGSFKAPPAGPKFATVAYNAATGAQLWAQTAKGSTGSRDITVSPDSSKVFVTGGTDPSAASVFTTIAYATGTGARLWAKQYHGPQASNVANAITVSPDGSQVFVTGHTGAITVNSPAYFATVAYAAGNGTQLWARTHPAGIAPVGGFTYGAIAIGVSPDGTLVFITGTTPGFRANSVNFTTIAYRAATGAASWVSRYRGRRDYANARDLAVSPTGQAVFVTGFVGVHDGCCDFGTVAYQP
jgi:outer membrane protein assembly factor BamB